MDADWRWTQTAKAMRDYAQSDELEPSYPQSPFSGRGSFPGWLKAHAIIGDRLRRLETTENASLL